MRLNTQGFQKCLKTDGVKGKFWHYTGGAPSYDPDTQLPVNPGSQVDEFYDTLDFTLDEIKNLGGLIDGDSLKLVLRKEAVLTKGDELLDDSLLEQYRITFVFDYKNRLQAIAQKTLTKKNQH